MLLGGLGGRAGDLGKLIRNNELAHVFGCKNSIYFNNAINGCSNSCNLFAAWKMRERDKDKEKSKNSTHNAGIIMRLLYATLTYIPQP